MRKSLETPYLERLASTCTGGNREHGGQQRRPAAPGRSLRKKDAGGTSFGVSQTFFPVSLSKYVKKVAVAESGLPSMKGGRPWLNAAQAVINAPSSSPCSNRAWRWPWSAVV
jgi:hypothetical protein